MSPVLVPALLLAALHVLWFFAFLVDARAERDADPIGRIFAAWLSREGAGERSGKTPPGASASAPPRRHTRSRWPGALRP